MKVCLDVLLNTDEDIHVNTKILSSITSSFLDFHCLTVNLILLLQIFIARLQALIFPDLKQ